MDAPILFLLLLVLYVVALFILRDSGYKEKIVCDHCVNCCPNCKEPLERVRRRNVDKLVNFLTFQMFGFKRYKCENCDWNGLRWEKKYNKQ